MKVISLNGVDSEQLRTNQITINKEELEELLKENHKF